MKTRHTSGESRTPQRPAVFGHRWTPRQMALALLTLCGMATLYVYQQALVEQTALEIRTLQIQRDRLKNLNEFARAEIDEMSRFSKIERQARDQLGMDFPTEAPAILVILPPGSRQGSLATLLDWVVPNGWGGTR